MGEGDLDAALHHSHSLSLTHTHSLFLSQTHTLSVSLSRAHTHTHTLALSGGGSVGREGRGGRLPQRLTTPPLAMPPRRQV